MPLQRVATVGRRTARRGPAPWPGCPASADPGPWATAQAPCRRASCRIEFGRSGGRADRVICRPGRPSHALRFASLSALVSRAGLAPSRVRAAFAAGNQRLPGCWDATEYTRHFPGTPFSSWGPRSSKVIPEPATRSFTVCETRTSPAAANAETRAPIETAIPATLPSSTSHSPACRPRRTSRPSARTASRIASAQRIARGGPSNRAKNPSPAVSSSTPRNRASCRRTRACSAVGSSQVKVPHRELAVI